MGWPTNDLVLVVSDIINWPLFKVPQQADFSKLVLVAPKKKWYSFGTFFFFSFFLQVLEAGLICGKLVTLRPDWLRGRPVTYCMSYLK